jgi:hypothetical protein
VKKGTVLTIVFLGVIAYLSITMIWTGNKYRSRQRTHGIHRMQFHTAHQSGLRRIIGGEPPREILKLRFFVGFASSE